MHRWVPGACACAWLMAFATASAGDESRDSGHSKAAGAPLGAAGSDSLPASSADLSDYLSGVAALDSGRLGDAVVALQRVVASQPDFSGARIELARARFASGNYSQAREEFEYLLTQSPPEQTRSVIQRYLDAIPGRRLFATSRWSGAAQLGAGYDSNANGSTSDASFLGFTLNPRNVETRSSFGELMLGGAHSVSLSPSVGLVTNAQLTHRANSDASFVDQSVVTLGSGLVWSRGDYRFSGGVDGYSGWLDWEAHERGVNFNASASRRFGDYEGAVSLRAGSLEYEQASLGIMDADRFLTGLSVTRANIGGRPVRAGLALIAGSDDAKEQGSPYGNDRFGARLFGVWQLRPDAAVYAELSNLDTQFDGQFFGSRRKDAQLGLTLSFDLQDFPAAGWSIAPRLRYLNNDSTVSLYEYDRFEAMLFIRRSFRGNASRRDAGQRRGYETQSQEGGGSVAPRRVVESPVVANEALQLNAAGTMPAKPEQSIAAVSALGLVVDLTDPQPLQLPQVSTAVSVPASSLAAFAASSTDAVETFEFNGSGNLSQFNEQFGTGSTASEATYLAGTAATVDFGSNGASGIRWGRWSAGVASVSTIASVERLDLRDTSLHWIAGPTFEAPPVLPVSGSTHLVLAGGTSPTDTFGRVGSLADAILTADFTVQQVRTELSLDINGYNWLATGSGPLSTGTARFAGSFDTVLVDGRVSGSGAFSGFLSTGALSPDQLNGAGLGYWLTSGAQELGTISGVAAFVPGSAQPLAPPLVQRDVAYATGKVDGTNIVGGAAANSRAQLTIDSNGNLRRFDAPVPHAMSGTLAVGLSSVTDTGADAATGMRWGRWEGGTVNVRTPPGTTVPNDFTDKSLHWIASNEFGAPPVLPQTGTATYTLIGNTDPTDTLGNAGSLGAANFNANFTTRVVTTQMTLNVGGNEWYASGSGTFPIGDHHFVGSYDDVRIQNIARGQGMMYGFFTKPRIDSATESGAGLSFSLTDNAGEMGVISGVLAFAEGGQSAVVAPSAPGQRDIAFASPDFAANETFVQRALPAEYALDPNFGLTSLSGPSNSNPAELARYDQGSSAIAESDVSPLLMLRWGRWSGGEATATNLVTNVSHAIDLSQQSLHWIEGADSAAPPVMPQFGTAHYAVMGATAPTDRAGHTGVLHNASLSANFTSQLVSTSLDFTVNNINVVAVGSGPIGAGGLPAHHFTGVINSGVISTTQGAPQGTFSGFFSAPGGTSPDMPGGAGITYSITDGQGLFVIDGAAAFRRP